MVKRFNFSLLIIFVSLSASFLFSKEPNDEKYIGRNSTPPVLIQWNLGDHPASIQADKAWDYTTGSSDVVVAVVDTGIDIGHPDLINTFLRDKNGNIYGYNAITNQWGSDITPPSNDVYISLCPRELVEEIALLIWYKSGDEDPIYSVLMSLVLTLPFYTYNLESDVKIHGTCVSSIIGAQTNNTIGCAGIAGGWGDKPGVRIMPFKCWPDLNVSVSGILMLPLGGIELYRQIAPKVARGIEEAANKGADIINLNFGGLETLQSLRDIFPPVITDICYGYYLINGEQVKIVDEPLIRDAIKTAHDKGCVIVTPAGNSINIVSLPGRDRRVICTAVGDKEKKLGFRSDDWGSSYGPEVAVIAPGDNILAAQPREYNPNDPYHDFGYNSAATPHTSGVAELVYSLLPKELRYINPDEPDLTKRVHRDGIQEIVRHIITRSSDKNIGQPEDGWRQAYWGYSQVGVPDKMKSDPYHGEGWLNAKSAVEMARDYEWRCDVKEIHLRSDFIIPDDVEIIIEDGNFTLKLNKEEWKEATITWNDLTYTPTSYYWVETEYNQPGIKEVKEDWDGHSLTVKVKLESWATMPAKFDRKYYLISCKKAFPYTNIVEKDKTGPSEVILTEPEKNKTINTTRPKFRWSSSIDTGEGITGTGISHYEIELTTVVPENPTESYKQPAGAILVKDFNDGEALSGGWKNCRGNATLSVDNGKLLFIPNSIDGNDVYAPRYNSHIYVTVKS